MTPCSIIFTSPSERNSSMSKLIISLLTAVGLSFTGTGMAAEKGADAEYTAAKNKAEADYKSAKEKCNALKGNAKDICMAEANGARKVAKSRSAGETQEYSEGAARGARSA